MDLTKFLLESLHLSKAKGAALIGHLLQEPMRDLPEGKQVQLSLGPAKVPKARKGTNGGDTEGKPTARLFAS